MWSLCASLSNPHYNQILDEDGEGGREEEDEVVVVEEEEEEKEKWAFRLFGGWKRFAQVHLTLEW